MDHIRNARNGGSLSTAALSKFEHLWTSHAKPYWVAWYTIYGNCSEIVYEKFDLGFDLLNLLRGSYVDGDLLRGFNFTAIRRQNRWFDLGRKFRAPNRRQPLQCIRLVPKSKNGLYWNFTGLLWTFCNFRAGNRKCTGWYELTRRITGLFRILVEIHWAGTYATSSSTRL